MFAFSISQVGLGVAGLCYIQIIGRLLEISANWEANMTLPHPELSLVHVVRPALTPATGKPPLLVLLHGVGSNEDDLFSFAGQLDRRFVIVSARGPLTRAPGSYAWYDIDFLPSGDFDINAEQVFANRDRIVQFIGEAIAAYDADSDRVYLLGFSQGAIMTLTTALTTPELLAGAAVMSGRLLDEVIPAIAPADQLAGLPLFVAHGAYDGVIDAAYGQAIRAALQQLPVALTFMEYPMRHEISNQAFFAVQHWLRDRLDGPRRVTPAG